MTKILYTYYILHKYIILQIYEIYRYTKYACLLKNEYTMYIYFDCKIIVNIISIDFISKLNKFQIYFIGLF